MKQLTKRLLAGSAGVLGFATAATALTLVVEYKPYGVPDHRRAEYEQKVAEISERSRLLKQLDQSKTPKAVVPSFSHDFGLMDPHVTATHAFEIRNEGSDPLALEVRETSCKCTVGSLGSGLLESGESTTVVMTWNTGLEADSYTQTATVVTNDPRMESILFTVKGEIRAELVVPEEVNLRASDPAETTQASFIVYSQAWNDFQVTNAESQLDGFEWYAEPVAHDAAILHNTHARSAWKITILGASEDYGEFEADLDLTIRPSDGGETVTRTIACKGRVRAPIGFYSPDIHHQNGLDIGTLLNGEEHSFHVVVRARGDEDRQLAVLDVQPAELRASLAPLKQSGSYRLTITVPADCPSVLFNGDHHHGYVQVGDREDDRFSNWFPLYGAVVSVR